jgi:hypothetical protein
MLSGRLAHRVGSAFAQLPAIVALVTSDNESAIVRMEGLRRRLRRLTLLCAALAVALGAQLGWQWWGTARD